MIKTLLLIVCLLAGTANVQAQENLKQEMAEHYYKGVELLNAGFYEAAIKEFDKVLEVWPEHVPSLSRKNKALEALYRESIQTQPIPKSNKPTSSPEFNPYEDEHNGKPLNNVLTPSTINTKEAPHLPNPIFRGRTVPTSPTVNTKEEHDSVKWKPSLFWSLEYFPLEGADKNWKNNAQDIVNLFDPFYDSVNGHIDSTDGIGGRIGLLYGFKQTDSYAGVSFGYIVGPSAKLKIDMNDSILGNGNISGDIKTQFYRFLVEGIKVAHITNKLKLHIKIGVGLARGKAKANETLTLLGETLSNSDSITWTGLTWEIAPALVYYLSETTGVTFGPRYSGFPKLKESEDWSEMKWTPFGFYLGLMF